MHTEYSRAKQYGFLALAIVGFVTMALGLWWLYAVFPNTLNYHFEFKL